MITVYVIVKYTLQNSRRYYAGVVTKVLTDKQCEVKFVGRSKTQKLLVFIFLPDAADFEVVDNDKIIQELMPNVNRRGVFNDNNNNNNNKQICIAS